MRKLIVILNAMIARREKWDASFGTRELKERHGAQRLAERLQSPTDR